MFHFNGAKHTTPNCPIQLSPDFNPSGGANYNRAGKDCKKNARYNIPFFTSEPGNRYEEWSINAHEGGLDITRKLVLVAIIDLLLMLEKVKAKARSHLRHHPHRNNKLLALQGVKMSRSQK